MQPLARRPNGNRNHLDFGMIERVPISTTASAPCAASFSPAGLSH